MMVVVSTVAFPPPPLITNPLVEKMNNVEKVLWSVVVALLLLLGYMLFGMLPVSLYAERICLEHNYPKSSTTWNFQNYCVRTVDQTEYVCSLDEVISNSCRFTPKP